ncbi:DedA family protein [Candidatus Woesearchaeota archaeon]|nr:DedA family protein [Candidatus Woesearchaeota archaeon]
MLELLGFVADAITGFIGLVGYAGIFVLMLLEGTPTPVPAELVMPFAGFLAAEGKLNLLAVILVGTAGVVAGNLVSYFIGARFGLPFLHRYGRFLLVRRSDVDWAVEWFSRQGGRTIFISRFIPVVRHIISVPAGVAGMNLPRFILFTFLGALIYSSFLALLGYFLGANWHLISRYGELASLVVVLLLAAAAFVYIRRHLRA